MNKIKISIPKKQYVDRWNRSVPTGIKEASDVKADPDALKEHELNYWNKGN